MNKHHGIVVCPGITVSDNYERLENKPMINGLTLLGNKSAGELNLLSAKKEDYEEVSINDLDDESYVVVIPKTGKPRKMKVADIKSGMFSTDEEVTLETMEVGEYSFIKLEG